MKATLTIIFFLMISPNLMAAFQDGVSDPSDNKGLNRSHPSADSGMKIIVSNIEEFQNRETMPCDEDNQGTPHNPCTREASLQNPNGSSKGRSSNK